jgi:proteasome lid subunit RPN8/RPN11
MEPGAHGGAAALTAPGAEEHHAARLLGDRVAIRGRFLIAAAAIQEAERLLTTFRGPDGDHEGLVFLAGRELEGQTTLLCTAIAPDCDHTWGSVMASEAAVGDVARAARGIGLALLAQVHSHPGASAVHSRGDDSMVLMPFEGMLSIVVPRYAHHGMTPLHSLGVHQFHGGEWRLAAERSIRETLLVVPASVDLR